ncbi:hypothetical protein [Agromyces salentinus]|nr:hypothetical protein [Agromyces salentinus]
MIDFALSDAVVAYVGFDGESAVPGRHRDRIADPVLQERVAQVVNHAELREPGNEAQGVLAWAQQRRDAVGRAHPELSGRALDAICALISFEWR